MRSAQAEACRTNAVLERQRPLTADEIAEAARLTLTWIRGPGYFVIRDYRARGATPSQAAGLAVRRATQYMTSSEISEIVPAVLKAEW